MSSCNRATTHGLSAGDGAGLGRDAGLRDLFQDVQHGCSRVVPAVRQVERLVDQRKVGNDVADHRMLEHRPVRPRRIVRMAARGSLPSGPALQRDQHRSAPAFDVPRAPTLKAAAPGSVARISSVGHRVDDRADEPQRFRDLVEAHGDARSDVAFVSRRHARRRARRTARPRRSQRRSRAMSARATGESRRARASCARSGVTTTACRESDPAIRRARRRCRAARRSRAASIAHCVADCRGVLERRGRASTPPGTT